ncbi:MAG: polysaccharide biosynthesis tyrosine autokinase [Ardenticatenaceae bacterium]|nr:polysaccharide biosynthesis tyrosine autokinase [Ardenticatenaceae bacterium]
MDLTAYISPLIKWWWLIATAAVLACGASFIAVRDEPIMYQSNTTLMIGNPFDNLNPDTNQFWSTQQLAEAYASFARREPVQNATMDALGMDWLPDYTAFVPPRTSFIEISVVDTDPLRAQVVASELANQLIRLGPTNDDQETQQRQTFINEQLDDLQQQILETQSEIETRQSELGDLFSAREIADSQEQILALQTKLSSLQQNYGTLLSNSQQQATNAPTVIEAAQIPNFPIGPNKYFTVLLSGVLGAVVATGAAYLLELLDDRIANPQDLSRADGVTFLTGIPHTKLIKESPSGLIVANHPRAPVAESLRDLRTAIQFSNPDKPLRTILITSPNSGEGKSFIASNLAVIMAHAGYKTLLIDGDMRKPYIDHAFGLVRDSGLSNLLLDLQNDEESNEIPLYKVEDYTHQIGDSSLYVLTSGSIPLNPSELLGSNKMQQLLDKLKTHFDYIVIDSPPALAVTDTMILSAISDGVILIVCARQTTRMQFNRVVNRLGEINVNLIGAVLNRMSKEGSGFYYYYDYGARPGSSRSNPGEKENAEPDISEDRIEYYREPVAQAKD